MTNYTIDNSLEADLNRTITWQYDHANRLVGMVSMMKEFAEEAAEDFWDAWPGKVVDIDSADDFGLSIWGKVMNVKRPNVTDGGASRTITTVTYRKILKARYALLNSQGTIPDYITYISSVFDGKCTVVDGLDMSMTFTVGDDADAEMKRIATQSPSTIFLYPAGVHDGVDCDDYIFGLAGQLEVAATDPAIGGLDESVFNWR